MKFKKVDGTIIEDVANYVKKYIEKFSDDEIDILIGCDSLPKAYKTATYSTVIALYRVGKGAHLIYQRETKIKTKNLYDRLWKEVEKSLSVAQHLRDAGVLDMTNIRGLDVHLHLDVNPDKNQKSNAILDSAVGYITAMGFKCSTKPEAPAASYAADMIARGKEMVGTTE